jgi:hypothetical protein
MAEIPLDILSWFRALFAECNTRITEKLSLNPNLPEESLDLTWIEFLSHYSTPVTLASNWLVKIDTHYLGGLRHFYGWEVADIGLLLFIRRQGAIVKSKVALLQSKRLYPTNARVTEEGKTDYMTGFARLADPEDLAQSIAVEAEFRFSEECRYGALIGHSKQVQAIAEYEKQNRLPIYYQLYNPWKLPHVQRVPIPEHVRPEGELELGVRILPSDAVHSVLAKEAKGFRPQLRDFAHHRNGVPKYGWRLENFVADEFLACREGAPFESIREARIQNLFYRRTGPIAAAIAITIEEIAPAG